MLMCRQKSEVTPLALDLPERGCVLCERRNASRTRESEQKKKRFAVKQTSDEEVEREREEVEKL
jgi:hypothetical protein